MLVALYAFFLCRLPGTRNPWSQNTAQYHNGLWGILACQFCLYCLRQYHLHNGVFVYTGVPHSTASAREQQLKQPPLQPLSAQYPCRQFRWGWRTGSRCRMAVRPVHITFEFDQKLVGQAATSLSSSSSNSGLPIKDSRRVICDSMSGISGGLDGFGGRFRYRPGCHPKWLFIFRQKLCSCFLCLAWTRNP